MLTLRYIQAAGITLGLSSLHGCSPSQAAHSDAALRSAVDLLGDTIDPISELSHRLCVARQDLENAAVRQGSSTTDKATENIIRIRARCVELRGIFNQALVLQNEAATLAEAELFEQARQKLAELTAAWNQAVKEEGLYP